jgi:hypothetical protein
MGMQARLGFGVAAFLEPSILLVDEVLAVGDAAFQQRCLDRMRYVLSQGTTLVFVSHDLSAVEATCARTIWLSQGRIVDDGPTRDVLGAYRGSEQTGGVIAPARTGPVAVRNVAVKAPESPTVQSNGPLEVELELESDAAYRAWVYLGISEGTAAPIFLVNPGRETLFENGRRVRFRCELDSLPLPKGRFSRGRPWPSSTSTVRGSTRRRVPWCASPRSSSSAAGTSNARTDRPARPHAAIGRAAV